MQLSLDSTGSKHFLHTFWGLYDLFKHKKYLLSYKEEEAQCCIKKLKIFVLKDASKDCLPVCLLLGGGEKQCVEVGREKHVYFFSKKTTQNIKVN